MEILRQGLRLALGPLAIILATLHCSGFIPLTSAAQTRTLTQEQWREDLRYMAQEVPKRHKYLFHTMTRQQFDDAVRKLDERIPLLARHQTIVELGRIVAMVEDGHTSINFLFDSKIGFRYYPVALHLFKDGLFVYAADGQYATAVGARVVKIGNASAEQALNAVRDLIARDNEMGFKDNAPLLLTTPEVLHAAGLIDNMEKAQFVVERQGQQTVIELKPMPAPRPNGDNWALGRNFSLTACSAASLICSVRVSTNSQYCFDHSPTIPAPTIRLPQAISVLLPKIFGLCRRFCELLSRITRS